MKIDKAERRVFLGMPGYGAQSPAAGRGFWRASKLPESHITHQFGKSSLLASNFNGLWCAALNMVHVGGRVDYFAMQHNDIEPEDWWLDSLIDELEAGDYDILGVVAPIKDTRGVSSLAIHNPSGDNWSPLCRLTMGEVHRLPPTFDSRDLGNPLLLNTGLWVCRFDQSWVKKVHFEINDRIVFDKRSDRYVPQTEPEDWQFSRLCHEIGLKVGATRKVRLQHRGEMAFDNQCVWGDPHDTPYLGESPAVLSNPNFPHGVDGWLTVTEGFGLSQCAAGKRVLEVGSYCGRSTICLAQTAESVVAVDPHDGRSTPNPKDTLEELKRNLEQHGVRNKVEIRVGTLPTALLPTDEFDVVFIDGAHDIESVQNDIEAALSVLADDGLLLFHDYREYPGQHDQRWDEGVTLSVKRLLNSGGELLSIFGTLAVVKPPAASLCEV